MAIEINRGIEPFDDTTDFTRGNKDRKPWGKSESAASLHLGEEYNVTTPPVEQPPVPPVVTPPVEPAKKFTHKLANGTTLEAATVEELAAQIEKALQQPPAPVPVDFEDKPLYQPYDFKPKELTLQEQADILNIWKENPQKALRMLQEADLGAPPATIIKMFQDTQTVLRQKLEEEAGAEFLGDHEDFSPTPANGKKLVEYLKSKGKPITRRNLGVAFQQLVAAGDQALVKKVEAAPVVPPPEEHLEEVPPPPVIVPSNQGRPEAPAPGGLSAEDIAKFNSLGIGGQKKYFADLKRRA